MQGRNSDGWFISIKVSPDAGPEPGVPIVQQGPIVGPPPPVQPAAVILYGPELPPPSPKKAAPVGWQPSAAEEIWAKFVLARLPGTARPVLRALAEIFVGAGFVDGPHFMGLTLTQLFESRTDWPLMSDDRWRQVCSLRSTAPKPVQQSVPKIKLGQNAPSPATIVVGAFKMAVCFSGQ